MGFIDMNGTLGRRFGSLGVALNDIETNISIRLADRLNIDGPSAAKARNCIAAFTQRFDLPDNLELSVYKAIPEHVGLGSGTQMSLAIGLALNALYELNLSPREIAQISGRGARSGIGIGIFEQGGFIVDGGHRDEKIPPPVISRMDFPSDWRIILVFDNRGNGLHGSNELEAFKKLPPFSQHQVARFCHLLTMQVLPELAEKNLQGFGDAISEIQSTIGEYFASAQGGKFTSADVAAVISWLGEQGAVGLGQSSWGPTGFCLAEKSEAEHLLMAAKTRFSRIPTLLFKLVSGRNSGGEVAISKRVFDVSKNQESQLTPESSL